MIEKISRFAILFLAAPWCALTASAQGASLDKGAVLTHFDQAARDGYRAYSAAPANRAFAIAPGGAWAWVSGADLQEQAEIQALDACRAHTEQPCQLYSVNDQVVFDAAAWSASWDLHMSAAAATEAPMGTGRGQRFPDLALKAPDGRKVALSALRGKPVVVHFWGSWCPPCQVEFPDLQKFYNALTKDDSAAFVLVQGHEPIAKSRRWAQRRGFTMPLYDSGQKGRGNDTFTLADGTVLNDRRLAGVYPTTYVLDANGLVVFRLDGPGKEWEQYEGMIRHIAAEGAR
ncbi:TlpA family protein disulfide reductase [Varunaivibrio sulfuroxidans]|uniref:Peroxiredoxin n=1 Tax=Varunaivibrio sulfuroxidans TaxID=1773489 RepID=A0A4V2UNL9_9PROT|nr:TlpA disulfide reductase family protein [Varunaivibrio sulfuroxidans]TCS62551.1 peroxiredoxin [Varunaivibrio sulfuroxidans]WES30779.1 TlpA disulfide reductase family protein [Varunaivibrio sulfuroxidans]